MLMVPMAEQDDPLSNMKELDVQGGLDTSIRNYFGDAPRAFNRGQGGTSPENNENQPTQSQPHESSDSQSERDNIVANAVLLVAIKDNLNEEDRKWIEENREILEAAVASGRIDKKYVDKLGIPLTPDSSANTGDQPEDIQDDPWKGTDWENGGGNGGVGRNESGSESNESLLAQLIRGHTGVPGVGGIESNDPKWFAANQDDVLNHPEDFGLTSEDQQHFLRAWSKYRRPEDNPDVAQSKPQRRDQRPQDRDAGADNRRQDFDDEGAGNRPENRGVFLDERLNTMEPGEQLKAVQNLLNTIEISERSINRHPKDIEKQVDFLKVEWANMMADPEAALERVNRGQGVHPEVLWQAVSRIRLHEFYCSIKGLNIYSDDAKKNIEAQIAQLSNDIPGGIDFAVLAKGKIETTAGDDHNIFENMTFMENIPVGDMMIRLQQIAVEGIQGRHWNANERSLDAPDVLRVKKILKEGLEGDTETAYRLASRSLFVLGELGVLDIPVMDADGKVLKAPEGPLGKMAYFEEARLAAQVKAQGADDIGPWLTVDMVPVLCSSAVRMATYSEAKIHLANEPLWAIIKDKDADPVDRLDALKKAYIFDPQQDNYEMINYKDLPYEKLSNAFLENHWKKTIPSRLKVRGMFLETEWNAADLIDSDKNEDRRTTLAEVEGALQPRKTLLYGIITQAAINMHGKLNTKNTIFDYDTWYTMKRAWTEGVGAIMSPEQWEAVEDICRKPPQDSKAVNYNTHPNIHYRLLAQETLARVIPTSR